jgi:hypothetical protein
MIIINLILPKAIAKLELWLNKPASASETCPQVYYKGRSFIAQARINRSGEILFLTDFFDPSASRRRRRRSFVSDLTDALALVYVIRRIELLEPRKETE